MVNELSRYVGRLFVKSSGKPQDILPKLRKMAGFLQDDDVELYEVSFIFLETLICLMLIWYANDLFQSYIFSFIIFRKLSLSQT